MRARLGALAHRVDALTLRERLFVLAAALVVVVGLWQALLAAPLDARERAASARVEAARDDIEQMNRTLEAAANGIGEGMPEKLARLETLRERVAANDESLHVFTSDLVDPTEMRHVLEDLIRDEPGLELVRMSNRPGEPLLENDEQADDARGPRLYRHGLVIELEGTYLEALDYLRTVETLPWRLHWSRLELGIDEYPRTNIRIELDTLSLDEEWIGV